MLKLTMRKIKYLDCNVTGVNYNIKLDKTLQQALTWVRGFESNLAHFPAQAPKKFKKSTPKKIPYISGNATF